MTTVSLSDSRATRRFADFAGQPNGINTIRLLAATGVLVSHAFPLTGFAEPFQQLPGGTSLGELSVGIFFVLSGYLISGSWDRSTLAGFIEKRARRILPALAVCVAVCVFALGPAMTSLPLHAYFAHRDTWTFASNALFLTHNHALPGVFATLPTSATNGSLWTLRYEVTCYGIVAAALAFRPFRPFAVGLVWLASFFLARHIAPEGGVLSFISYLSFLFRYFGAGMVMYLYAHALPADRRLAMLGGALAALSAFTPFFPEAAATVGAYALMVFAFHAPHRFRRLTAKGDVSYGVYLYAYPIQQLLVPLALRTPVPWLADMALALPLTFLAGVFSWHFVERPMLRRRRAGKVLTTTSPA